MIKEMVWMICSFLAAFLLLIVPLPASVIWFRPNFVMLLVLFWSLHHTHGEYFLYVWVVGLFCDVLTGFWLGEQAFSLILVAYLGSKFGARLKMFSGIQQMWVVCLFGLGYQLIIFWLQCAFGDWRYVPTFWWSVLTSALIWPLLPLIFERFLYHVQPYPQTNVLG